MGEVCLADDLTLQRQVALKFLTSADGDALDRLLSEARAAAALDHPFICSIYEVTDVDSRPCIAMEYVRGETLERRLRRGPPELNECLRIADEIAEALEAAHNRRVIHGDLKPANVMLTEGQHIKVMDFGLATRLPMTAGAGDDEILGTGAGDMGVLRGTPAYMAPEQIRGAAADRRSDIFSFGILLHELLTGTNPFMRVGVLATLGAIVDEEIGVLLDRTPSIPKSVGSVVAQLLAKDPTRRYQSFGGVRSDLRRLAADVSAPRPAVASIVVDQLPNEGGKLIGRVPELAQLLQGIEQAASKRGSLVLVSGEAGIGKTRLAEEALNAARRRGFQTLVGRCYEEEGTPPLIPYIGVLEQAARLMPAQVFHQAIEPSAPELAKLLPELYRLFPNMAVPLELPPALRQRFLFTNFLEFLSRASFFAPVVIFVDDLQWADESTLQLTQHLAEHLAGLPIVIIAAHRDIEASAAAKGTLQNLLDRVRRPARQSLTPQAFKASLDRLVRERHARNLVLHPFTEPEVRRMLAALAGDEPPAGLVGAFVEHTGGNPFFLAELFRHLKEEGLLFDDRKRWRRGLALDGIDVPESVRGVLERRLERVSEETQKVLKAAAVIGRHFKLDLLEAVANVDNDTLISALDEAERSRLLKGPSGRQEVTWRFAHRLICQMLTGSIPQLRRQQLHLRVAEAMVRLDAPSRAYTSEIAHHLYCAGHMADSNRTARALVTAGDAAHAVYATEEAIGHYVRALEMLEAAGADQSARHDVAERLADLLALVGDHGAAMTRYQTLARTHESLDARVALARIVRKMGMLHWHAGDRSQAMACYQRALQTVDGMPAHIEVAHLLQELGLAAFRKGDNREAIDWCERAVLSAELALSDTSSQSPLVRKEATAALAHATNTIGVAMARLGQMDAARERIERSLTAARETGLLEVACRAYANLGVLYSSVEPKRAIDVSIAGLEIAAKMAALRLQSYLYANLAAAYCALTDQCETEGLQAAQAAIKLDRELGQLDHLAVPLIVMGQIHQCRGELKEARQAYDEALMLAEKIGEPQLILPCYDGLATICLDLGDMVGAEQYLQKARDLCERAGLDPDATLLLPFLC